MLKNADLMPLLSAISSLNTMYYQIANSQHAQCYTKQEYSSIMGMGHFIIVTSLIEGALAKLAMTLSVLEITGVGVTS